jgi:hypothetical protein
MSASDLPDGEDPLCTEHQAMLSQVVQLWEVSGYLFEQMKVTRDRYKSLPLLANQMAVLSHKHLQPMAEYEPLGRVLGKCPT